MQMLFGRRAFWAVAAAFVLAHALILAPLPPDLRGLGALLLLGLPGALLARWLFHDERDGLARGFLGLCGAVSLAALLLLGALALPGPAPRWLLLLLFDGLTLAFGLLTLRRTVAPAADPRGGHPYLLLTLVLLLGAALRLLNLGVSEFQGDEARAMILALDSLLGRDDLLLLHKKGPVEALLPAGPMALLGQATELIARLPFALAGVGTVLGVYLLGRALADSAGHTSRLSSAAGLIAATIVALDGLLLAYSRIVQYQSALMLMGTGAVWCGWQFYRGVERPLRYALFGAGLAAVGVLAHYDGVLVLPALAWLLLAGGARSGWSSRAWALGLGAPVALFAAIAGSFYVPFALQERFGDTAGYVLGRIAEDDGGLRLVDNLTDYVRLATFYNTTFQVYGLAAALLAAMAVWLAVYVRPRAVGWAASALLLFGAALYLLAPDRLALGEAGSLAILVFGLPTAVLTLGPGVPAWLRTPTIWFGVPFAVMFFVLVRPGTHYYTMNVAGALLFGLAATGIARRLLARRQRWALAPLAAAGAALGLLAAPYAYIAFVRQNPEFVRDFPASRPPIYRAAYGDQRPRVGYFGFPHRSGWKAIGELGRLGVLHGDYESNDDYYVTQWYTRNANRCDQAPVFYIYATAPAGVPRAEDAAPAEMQRFGTVEVEGATTLEIYSADPVSGPPQVYDAAEHFARFDRYQFPGLGRTSAAASLAPLHVENVGWASGVLLESVGVDVRTLAPRQRALLWLNWRVAEVPASTAVVVEILNEAGEVVAQPEDRCSPPPARWAAGRASRSLYHVTVDERMPPGRYTVRVGLRDGQRGGWLPLADGSVTLAVAELGVR